MRSIHVQGETGTGKELIADLIRFLEPDKPMITVNCASLSSSLLESELFGHTRGAFTGAGADRKGFVELAHNGWLFLDEVNSLSLEAQGCLLRVIENQEIVRVGERTPRKVNFRLLTATNQDTDELLEKRLMRLDFQQRIKEAVFHLKPLRERREEIPELVQHFLKGFQTKTRITTETVAMLQRYSYQRGNIRELRSIIRAADELGRGQTLTLRCLPPEFWQHLRQESAPPPLINLSAPSRISTAQRKKNQLNNFWRCLKEFTELRATPLSVKAIAENFSLSESSISRRLREIVHYRIAPLEEVNAIVRLRLKDEFSTFAAAEGAHGGRPFS